MITSAITLMIITVVGGLVYFALERKLARAPVFKRADAAVWCASVLT